MRMLMREPQGAGVVGVIVSVAGLLTGAAGRSGFKGLAGRHARSDLLTFGVRMGGEIKLIARNPVRGTRLSGVAAPDRSSSVSVMYLGRPALEDAEAASDGSAGTVSTYANEQTKWSDCVPLQDWGGCIPQRFKSLRENAMKILKPVSMALMMVVGGSALAADCSAEVEGNDAMQFNKTSMTMPAS